MEIIELISAISTPILTIIFGGILYYQNRVLKTQIDAQKEILSLYDVGKLKEGMEIIEKAQGDRAWLQANQEWGERVANEFIPMVQENQATIKRLGEDLEKRYKSELKLLKKNTEIIQFASVLLFAFTEEQRIKMLDEVFPENKKDILKVVNNLSPETITFFQERWRKNLNN